MEKKVAENFKGIGVSSIHNLIINTAVPVLVAYAKQIDNHELVEKALAFLEEIPAVEKQNYQVLVHYKPRNKKPCLTAKAP